MGRLKIPQITLIFVALMVFAIASYGQVPNYINYQGRLIDSDGQPVTGSKQMKFKIYGSSSGNDSLWSSTFRAVQIDDGLFDVKLGEVVPLPEDLFDGFGSRYLGITVDTDAEIQPRTQFITVPYAYHSTIADSAKSAPASPDGDWAINGNDIYHESGNVGIGTTMPTADLVVGNDLGAVSGKHVVIGDDDTGAYPGLVIGRSGQYQGWLSYNVDGDYMNWGTKEGGSFYSNTIVNKAGRVGIGVTSPSERLVVGKDLGYYGMRYIVSGSAYLDDVCGYRMGYDSDNQAIMEWNGDGASFALHTRSGGNIYNDIIVAQYGNVGLGASPVDTSGLTIKRSYNTDAYGQNRFGIESYVTGTGYPGYVTAGNFVATSVGGEAAVGIRAEARWDPAAVNVIGGVFYSDGLGILVDAPNAATFNGVSIFNGNVHINGNLDKSSGSFKIDHPLDPENKYLQHSFVESPDMLNIYNGNVITNEDGLAEVILPEYFEALNKDFRYQLTVIGQFARAIIDEKISNGRFTIRTDKPNVEVSWQVTGIRQDPWANENRIEVEVDKPVDERGCFIVPELYGYGEERSIGYKERKKLGLNPE